MKAWMMAAALGLAAAAGVLAPGTAQASSSAWAQAYQVNASGSFEQIVANADHDIWAVGNTYTAAGKTVYQPFVRHFNGKSWQVIAIPDSSGSTAEWVSASSPSNVWVGALKDSSTSTSVIYRWNGRSWAKIPLPAMTSLENVVVLSPDNVWATGDSGTVAYDIFHWNGSKWQYYLPNVTNFIPQGLSASAANNVWVSGFEYSGRNQVVAAYRWDGTGWHAVSMPHPVFNNGGPNVSAFSSSNVWIGWYDNTSTHALYWNGLEWRSVSPSYEANPLDIVPDGKGGYWFGPGAILTGSTWTDEVVPSFTGDYGDVTRIPGTPWFLLTAGVEASGSSIVKPTIFQFDF
jgi:hypothetical protein